MKLLFKIYMWISVVFYAFIDVSYFLEMITIKSVPGQTISASLVLSFMITLFILCGYVLMMMDGNKMGGYIVLGSHAVNVILEVLIYENSILPVLPTLILPAILAVFMVILAIQEKNEKKKKLRAQNP